MTVLAVWTAFTKIPAWLWEALGVLALGLFIYHAGYSAAHVDTLKSSIENLHQRKSIDAEIHSGSDVQLCRTLGGLRDECGSL